MPVTWLQESGYHPKICLQPQQTGLDKQAPLLQAGRKHREEGFIPRLNTHSHTYTHTAQLAARWVTTGVKYGENTSME